MPFDALAFILGDLLFQQQADFPSVLLFQVALLAALISIKFHKRFLIALLIGWFWAAGYAYLQLQATALAPHFEGQELFVQGVVKSLPLSDERRIRFDFELTENPLQLPNTLRLSWYYPDPEVRAGQRWLFKVKLKAVHGLMNPGGFDYERWMFAQGIGATGYIRAADQAKLLAQTTFWQSPNVIRQSIADKLTAIPQLHYLGFLQALTIGKTDRITPEQWQVLRKTGTLHLMAISGSHISLIAGLSYFLVWRLQLRLALFSIAPQRIAAVISGLIGFGYALLAGFSVPVQRALVMLLVALCGILWQRQVNLSHLIAVAILLVVVWDPLAVLAAGFWLSFLAVMLIFYSLSWRLGAGQYWRNVLKVHGITALGLAPVLVGFFQQLSFIAPFANFIAVPVINVLIVPLALAAIILLFITPELATALLLGLDFGLAKLYVFLQNISEWHFATLTGIKADALGLILASLGFLVLFMPRGMPGRSLALFLCLPLFVGSLSSQFKPGEFKVTLLDIGQGLATVVQTQQHVLVYDTGIKFSGQSDSAQSVIMPYLASQGLRHIDTLVVSHGDNDHIGGAASLLAEFKPDALMTSVPEKLADYSPQRCLTNQHWQWDGVDFSMLAPPVEGFIAENDNSCVLKISSANGAVLLTGDIEQPAETWLVQSNASALSADVLIAPHHGSQSSSTLTFLRQINPAYILIPAGYQNPFKFPHSQVLERYLIDKRHWLNVSDQGAITVTFSNKQIIIDSYRNHLRKYWHKFHSSATFKQRIGK